MIVTSNFSVASTLLSIPMGRIAERIGFDTSATQKITKENTLNLPGNRVGVSLNLAATITKKMIKLIIKKSIDIGFEI